MSAALLRFWRGRDWARLGRALQRPTASARFLLMWYRAVDRGIWEAWWVLGGRQDGIARFRWYCRLEDRFQLLYYRLINPLFGWIVRNIGD